MVIFGTDLLVTSPRFISGPALRRMALEPGAKFGVGFQFLGRLGAGDAEVGSAHDDAGHAVVDQGAVDAVDHVTRMPVGSSAPQLEPAVSAKVIGTGAAVPGTPSMRAPPT